MLDVTRKGAVLRPPKTGVSGVGQSNAHRPLPDTWRSAAGTDGLQSLFPADQNGVDQAVLLGLGRRHDLVAVDVLANLLGRLARVAGDELLELRAHPEDLAGLDLDVRPLTVAALGGR